MLRRLAMGLGVLLLAAGCGSVEVGVVPTATATPSVLHYENRAYGFAFDYGSGWALSEAAHHVRLRRGDLALTIAYKRSDEAAQIAPTNYPAGDLVYAQKVRFLGETIPAQALMADRKVKLVMYETSQPATADGLLFNIRIEPAGELDAEAYAALDITDAVLVDAGQVLASLVLVAPSAADGPSVDSTPAPAAEAGASGEAPEERTEPQETPLPDASGNAGDLPAPEIGTTRLRARDGMVMVYVPGGTFSMGTDDAQAAAAMDLCMNTDVTGDRCRPNLVSAEQPAHTVTLDAYWIDQTEVTVAHYQACVDVGVCDALSQPPGMAPRSDDPATGVFFDAAAAYCVWAGGRLPTEAEWAYAARGPEGRVFPWGADLVLPGGSDGDSPAGESASPLSVPANICDAACGTLWDDPASASGMPGGCSEATCGASWAYPGIDDGYPRVAPVGSFSDGASWCSALDLAGNVAEWTRDWMGPYTAGDQHAPTGPVGEGEFRVVRGGSYLSTPSEARSSARAAVRTQAASQEIGFRCVIPVASSDAREVLP